MPLRPPLLGLACAVALVCLPSALSAAGSSFQGQVDPRWQDRAATPDPLDRSCRPPAAQVKEVDFLIDGSFAWIEHDAPYIYADDGGYLVTSLAKPRASSFLIRVFVKTTTADGIEGHRARVLPRPECPPSSLAGTWQRSVDDTSGAPTARFRPATRHEPDAKRLVPRRDVRDTSGCRR